MLPPSSKQLRHAARLAVPEGRQVFRLPTSSLRNAGAAWTLSMLMLLFSQIQKERMN